MGLKGRTSESLALGLQTKKASKLFFTTNIFLLN